MRVDRFCRQQFARGIDNCDFATGSYAGVDTHCHVLAGGCGQQQVLQVFAKNTDGFFFGAFAELAHKIELKVQCQFDTPGPPDGVVQPLVGCAIELLDTKAVGNALLARVGRCTGCFLLKLAIQYERNL